MIKNVLAKSTVVLKRPWIIIGLAAAMTVVFGMAIPDLKLDNDLKNSLPVNLPARADYDYYEGIFGSNTIDFIGFYNEGGIYNPELLAYIQDFSGRVEDMSRYIPRMNVARVLELDSEELARIDIADSEKNFPEASLFIEGLDMFPLAAEITPENMDEKLPQLKSFLMDPQSTADALFWEKDFAEKIADRVKGADIKELYRGYLNPVEEVTNVLNTDYIVGEGDKLIVEKVFTVKDENGSVVNDPEFTAEAVSIIKERMESWTMYNGALISFDEKNTQKDESSFAQNPDMTAMIIKLNPDIGIEFRQVVNNRIFAMLENDLGKQKPSKDAQGRRIMVKRELREGETINFPALSDTIYYITGEPVIADQISTSMKKDLGLLFPLVVIVIIVALYLSFRNIDGVLYPMISVLLSTVWALGAMSYADVPVNLVTTSLPVLLIAAGSAYGIHLMNGYFMSKETSRVDSMRTTVSGIGAAILMAGLTTVAGFGSNVTSKLVGIRNFGIFTALGVFFAVLTTLYVVPAIICTVKRPKKNYHFDEHEEANDWIHKTLALFSRIVTQHTKATLVTALLLIAVFAFGVFNINVNMNNIKSFKPKAVLSVADRIFNDKLSGTQVLSMILETRIEKDKLDELSAYAEKSVDAARSMKKTDEECDPYLEKIKNQGKELQEYVKFAQTEFEYDSPVLPDKVRMYFDAQQRAWYELKALCEEKGLTLSDEITSLEAEFEKLESLLSNEEEREITQPEVLAKLDELENYLLEKYPEISKVASINTLMKKMNKEMNQGDEAFYVLPDTKQKIDDYLLLYSGDIDGLINIHGGKNKLKTTITITRQGTTFIDSLEEDIYNFFYNENPDFIETYGLRVNMTNVPHLASAGNALVTEGQIKSVATSIIIVAILLYFILGSVKLSCVALIPIIFGMLTNFGFMGLLGIDLNLATSLVASVAVGVGIDYAIHFTNYYKMERSEGRSLDQAIDNTILHTGRAIFYNVISVTLGFLVLLFSEFVPIIDFSILLSVCMIATGLGSLLLIPSVIKLFRIEN